MVCATSPIRGGSSWSCQDPFTDDSITGVEAVAIEARLFRRAAPAHDRVRPDCAYIHRELKCDGVTLELLWEEYTQVHPHGYRRTQFL